jgi:hypothetical protein
VQRFVLRDQLRRSDAEITSPEQARGLIGWLIIAARRAVPWLLHHSSPPQGGPRGCVA